MLILKLTVYLCAGLPGTEHSEVDINFEDLDLGEETELGSGAFGSVYRAVYLC